MKHLKKFETFSPYDDEPLTKPEEIFGKQTRLEKQFSKIVQDGLMSEDDVTSRYWSTFNALKIEIEDIIGTEDDLYKELQHRVVEGENPTGVMNDISAKVGTNGEIERLLKKLNSL